MILAAGEEALQKEARLNLLIYPKGFLPHQVLPFSTGKKSWDRRRFAAPEQVQPCLDVLGKRTFFLGEVDTEENGASVASVAVPRTGHDSGVRWDVERG